MEIKKVICKSGREYQIVNEYWENSYAWGHKSTLIGCCGEIENNKVRYQNRTWEMYKYQTCMSGLISKILDDDLKRFTNHYKEISNIKRLTKDKKEQLEKQWKEQVFTQDLLEIKERIKNRVFD